MAGSVRFNAPGTVITLAAMLCCGQTLAQQVAQQADQEMAQEFAATTPQPRDEAWWTERHAEKTEQAAEGDAELILIGDSITHGWEGVGKQVFREHFGDLTTLNLGYSGDRTEHVLWRLQHGELDGLKAKAVVIMIGTNNTGHQQGKPTETAAGIRKIVDEVRQRVPSAKILLLAVFPRGATEDDPLRMINQEVNRLIAAYDADPAVEFLYLNDHFLDESGNLRQDVMPDLLHPNEKGYRVWAKAMEPQLSELLGQPSTP